MPPRKKTTKKAAITKSVKRGVRAAKASSKTQAPKKRRSRVATSSQDDDADL